MALEASTSQRSFVASGTSTPDGETDGTAFQDLSVAVDALDSAGDVGDRVRNGLGDNANVVEEVAVLSESSYSELPAAAVELLGMADRQKNVLIRVTLRPFERTLSDGEANHIRDRIYEAVHQGSKHQWATGNGSPDMIGDTRHRGAS
jgi:phenylalanyl-tRNA synthetase alpha chain